MTLRLHGHSVVGSPTAGFGYREPWRDGVWELVGAVVGAQVVYLETHGDDAGWVDVGVAQVVVLQARCTANTTLQALQ